MNFSVEHKSRRARPLRSLADLGNTVETVADDKIPLTPAGPTPAFARSAAGAPAEGRQFALAQDDRGQYTIPFPLLWKGARWHNAQSGEPLAPDVRIVSWKPWGDRHG